MKMIEKFLSMTVFEFFSGEKTINLLELEKLFIENENTFDRTFLNHSRLNLEKLLISNRLIYVQMLWAYDLPHTRYLASSNTCNIL